MARWSLALLMLAGCASPPNSKTPASPPIANMGPKAAAEAFVAAVQQADTRKASELVAWDLYVAEDARLRFLLDRLKNEYAVIPPTPELRTSKPFPNSDVTLGQLLEHRDPALLLPGVAQAQFEANLAADLASPKAETELLAWYEDSREAAATVLMPNGQPTELKVIPRGGRYRLIPLFRR